MRIYQHILQTSIILLVIGFNSYIIGNAIRLESGWAILGSIASLCALGYCIHLFRKLNELDTEEQENY
jgi:hypothetical protein